MQFAFLLFSALLAMAGLSRDRVLWKLLALSTAFHLAMNMIVFDRYDEAWVTVASGAIECLTIALIRLYAWTELGRKMSLVLGIIAIWDCIFYVDFESGSYLVYGFYNELITILTIVMLALGKNGFLHSAYSLKNRLGDRLLARRPVVLSRASRKRVAFRKGS